MNRAHSVVCSSGLWARSVERKLLPWGLGGVDLGEDVLEIGPGFGATTRVLARRSGSLTVLELSESYCERLRRTLEDNVEIVQADATAMPFADGRFSAVVCFTMLHHVPSPALQDRLFAEVFRVLRAGGVFVNAEQVSGASALFDQFNASWHEAGARQAGSDDAEWGGALERMAHDRCAPVERQLSWLEQAGFADADCVFKDHRFAVLVAKR